MVTIPDFHILVVDVPALYIVRLDSACPCMCKIFLLCLKLRLLYLLLYLNISSLNRNSLSTHMPIFLSTVVSPNSALLLISCNSVYYISYLDAYIYICWH